MRAGAARNPHTALVAGVQQRPQPLVVVALAAPENRVDLVEQQRRMVGLDLAVQDRFARRNDPPRSRDDELEHRQQPAFAGTLLRARHREVGRHVERVVRVGVQRPQHDRDRLGVAEHDEPAQERLELVEQHRELDLVEHRQPRRHLVELVEAAALDTHRSRLPNRRA